MANRPGTGHKSVKRLNVREGRERSSNVTGFKLCRPFLPHRFSSTLLSFKSRLDEVIKEIKEVLPGMLDTKILI